MKKELLLILLLLVPGVFAAEISFFKPQYAIQETLQASIKGNFQKPITLEDISFFSGKKQVSMVYSLARINDIYYLYAILPNQPYNLSLVVKADYIENNSIKTEIRKNFTTISSNSPLLSFSPGFIITKSDFSILFENKGSKTLSFTASFNNKKQSFTLDSGEIRKAIFPAQGVLSSYNELEISGDANYKIPVQVILEKNKTLEQEIMDSGLFKFNPSSIILESSPKEINLVINLTDYSPININATISVSSGIKEIVSVNPDFVSLKPGTEETINLKIKGKLGNFSGFLTATSSSLSASLSLKFLFRENATFSINSSAGLIDTGKSCLELGGRKCTDDEQCSSAPLSVFDGACCISPSTCEPKPASSKTWIWILLILLILSAMAFFLFLKFKKIKNKPEDIINDMTKKFEERMNPGTRVDKSLSKV
jgi:hypothetical protein